MLDQARSRLAVALDLPTPDEALRLARAVELHVGVAKVGLELFIAAGPSFVRELARGEQQVFLDLKLHDIPETVARAVGQACELGVSFLTLHAGGGRAMMTAAAKAAAGSNLTLLAVTVLTSLGEEGLGELGVAGSVEAHVLALAQLAAASGINGLVASPLELTALKAALPESFVVTPGIRPQGGTVAREDQTRIATPASAIRAGASMLVVGRPLRDAPDRAAAAQQLNHEVTGAMA